MITVASRTGADIFGIRSDEDGFLVSGYNKTGESVNMTVCPSFDFRVVPPSFDQVLKNLEKCIA